MIVAVLASGWNGTRAVVALAVAAAVSIVVSVSLSAGGGLHVDSAVGRSAPVEALVLLALTVIVVRRADTRSGVFAAVLAAAATGALVLRYAEADGGLGTIAGVGVWATVAIAAVIVGLQLRSLDARRDRSVAEAQRDQRLRLARDLHDFVAHDVSEVLAQAQAGQIVAGGHEQCAALFTKIEDAAQRALRSMDQTVHLLHPPMGDAWLGGGPRRDLSEIRALVARFADANGVDAAVHVEGLDDAELAAVPATVSATLYRVTVEALTNVRRHAGDATTVEVAVCRSTTAGGHDAIEVTVADDASASPTPHARPESRRSGLGLATARARLEEMGGSLVAGPRHPRGWEVTAAVPLPATAGGGR